MTAKFFGEFLLERNLITQQILDDVLGVQRNSNLMLGELAVSMGVITEQEALEINLRQQVQNKRFGEIAEELGLLGNNQLGELLLKQQRQRKYFGKILVELGFLSDEEMEKQLIAHQNERNQVFQSMLQSIKHHDLGDYLIAIIEATNLLFLRTLHVKSSFSQLLETIDNSHAKLTACQISIGGQKKLSFALATNTQTAAIITSKFTHQPLEDCDEDFSSDALGEFLNILVGHFIEDVSIDDNTERSDTKISINLIEHYQQSHQALIAEMSSQIGTFIIIIND